MAQHVNWRSPSSGCRTKSLPIRIRPDDRRQFQRETARVVGDGIPRLSFPSHCGGCIQSAFSDEEQMLGNVRLLIFVSSCAISWNSDELAVFFALPLL
jgi:hypothetical protein